MLKIKERVVNLFWRKFLSKTLKVAMCAMIVVVLGLTSILLETVISSSALLVIWAVEAFVILLCFSNIGLRLEEIEHLENIEKYLKVINESMGNDAPFTGSVVDELVSLALDSFANKQLEKLDGNSSNSSTTHSAPPPAAGWVCPDCKNTNKSYAEFCAKCGANKPSK